MPCSDTGEGGAVKALRIIAQVVGYLVVALAAVMAVNHEYYACAFLLVVGLGELWIASRLLVKKPTPEELEQQRRQRMAEDEAWHRHVQQDIRREQAAPRPQSPPPPPPRQENDWERRQRQTQERKQRAAEEGVACCPRCGSTSLSLNKKGFGGGKATAGMFVAGVPGAVAGTFGMNKMKITCLNCGYTYKPKKRTGV